MRLDHPSYITLVIAAYNKKRVSNELSPLLVRSTPLNIKKACVRMLQEGGQKKDEQMLKAYFGPAENQKQLLQLIQDFEIDKFRPLDKFLKGEPKKLNDIDLELLAWLIDFKHRPYSFGMEVIMEEEEKDIIKPGKSIPPPINKIPGEETKDDATGIIEELQGTEEPVVINQPPPTVYGGTAPIDTVMKKNKREQPIVFLLILVTFIAGVYIWQQIRENAGCMYWTGDHYEPVACDEDPKGRIFLPLDKKMQRNFERITRKDTLTTWSINRMYYVSDKNKIEYFTAPGPYPKDLKRNVRKLTQLIFDNDSINRRLSANDSLVAKK